MIALDEVATFFVEAADTLTQDFDVVDVLHTITERSARVSGAAAVGLMLADHHRHLRYMAASNEDGKVLELIQLGLSEGPCPDCYATGSPVVNTDLTSPDTPWPQFAPRAVQAGFRSVHAFPLRLRGEPIGAMSIFGDTSSQFTDTEVALVQALADVATISVLQDRAVRRAETLTEQLQGALNSRILIEQAKGACASAAGITVTAAFDRMRHRARSTGRRLTDVATDVIDDPRSVTSWQRP